MKITKSVRDAMMKSVVSILGEPTSDYTTQIDGDGNTIYDTNDKSLEKAYCYIWEQDERTLDIEFFDGDINVIFISKDLSLDVNDAVFWVSDCTPDNMAAIASDFLNNDIQKLNKKYKQYDNN